MIRKIFATFLLWLALTNVCFARNLVYYGSAEGGIKFYADMDTLKRVKDTDTIWIMEEFPKDNELNLGFAELYIGMIKKVKRYTIFGVVTYNKSTNKIEKQSIEHPQWADVKGNYLMENLYKLIYAKK